MGDTQEPFRQGSERGCQALVRRMRSVEDPSASRRAAWRGPRPAVVGLDHALSGNPSLTGAKAASLARAAAAGLPVLPGAVLTTAAASPAAAETDLRKAW